ncbi:hypothetical protein [Bacillus rhizoplanae]|uniref:hypothetical protein n=1 Tax=Bacillus rhizoplanae TaxID=2880966 RepID=UPI003D1A2926
MNNSLTNLLKNKFILIVILLIGSFHMINLGIFLLIVFGVSMLLDAPNAEYPPIVMSQLYPPLIGYLFLFSAILFCYFYQKFASESHWKKRIVQGIFLVFALIIPIFLGAFKIPLVEMLMKF